MSEDEQQQQQNTQNTEPKQENANETINIKVRLAVVFSPLALAIFVYLLGRDG